MCGRASHIPASNGMRIVKNYTLVGRWPYCPSWVDSEDSARGGSVTSIKAAIAALWIVLGVDAILDGRLIGPDQSARMLLLSVTITASVMCFTCHMQRSSDEVFNEGREHERRLMLREMNECKVLPFDRSGS